MEKKNNSNKETKVSPVRYRVWFMINTIFTVIYLIWRACYTLPFEYGWVSITAGLALFIVEFLGMFEAMIHFFNMNSVENISLPEIPMDSYPDVDVFIATYNETTDLLYKTVNGCLYMDYPDKSKVHIYLCDDGHRPEVKALAAKKGIRYFDREDNKHAKAGNLNNALGKTKSPLIVTFDADMIPQHEFLMHTVPYFVAQEMENAGKEEKDQRHIGFVQTPQHFYNPDLFQFNLFSEGRIPNEQDFFYRDIQVSRNKSNSPIYGGSNTMLSRRALEDIGGFYAETITEDYATGILMQKKKYICYATNEILASGLSPTDLKSLIDQRIRWARGVIQTNRKLHVFFTKGLTFSQRMNYWASKWYWYVPLKRLIYFMSPILYATFGYTVIKCDLLQILIFWLPMYITSNISLRMLSRNIRSTKWTSIYETVLFPYLIIPVLLETFGIKMKKFKVTKKEGPEKQENYIIHLIPFALLGLLSIIGIIRCLIIILDSGNMGPVVVLFWLIVNLYTLCMSTFFIIGRNILRKNERAMIQLPCTTRARDRYQINCITGDVSETGYSLLVDNPVDFDNEQGYLMEVKTERYTARLKGSIANVSYQKNSNKWKYAFRIISYEDTYDEYLQIIYDRVATLPLHIKSNSGSFDDLRINVKRRVATPFFENRCRPRVPMNVQLMDTSGKTYQVVDFNYEFLKINPGESEVPDKMTLLLDKAGELKCKLSHRLENGLILYELVNYPQIALNKSQMVFLEQWVFEEWHKYETEIKNQEVSKEIDAPKKTEEAQEFDETQLLS
ncbi:MAG: cellulose synthase catalytic subunit [Lachnospiraceae bacterium]